MPVTILYPSGAGAFQEWTVNGGGTAQAALAAAGGSYLVAPSAGLRVRVALDDLPGAADTITSVMAFGLLAVEDDGPTARLVLRLSGAVSLGAEFSPLSGGYSAFSATFPLAPDGEPWTVARVNALEGGADCVTLATGNMLFDQFWVAVDYAEATLTAPPEPWAEVRFPDTLPQDIDFPGSAEVDFPDPSDAEITFPGSAEVNFPDTIAEIEVTPKSS